jgi:arylamine N-acetyltransferase
MRTAIVLLLSIAWLSGCSGQGSTGTGGGQPSSGCDSAIDAHVYHPQRLQGNHTCMAAVGTVREVKSEDDGDYHIQLELDAGQSWMLAPGNYQRQHGYLVLEVICAHSPVTQADAQQPCSGYTSHVTLPKKGDHVSAVGEFIFDAENTQHDWNELHPVSSIRTV